MALIARDLMVGNPQLAEMGFGEEAQGHNAIAGGFQGQRQWTDHFPNGDFLEAILNTSFDWNGIRAPYIVATENDALNGASMLFGHLLTNTAQIFADVRTYWSPDAVKRVTGYQLDGPGSRRHSPPDQLRPGRARRDRRAERRNGEPAMKPFWEISDDEVAEVPQGDDLAPVDHRVLPRRRALAPSFLHPRRHAGHDVPHQPGRRASGPVLQIAEGYTVDLPEEVHDALDERTNPTWPTTWFVPTLDRQRRVPRRLHGDEPTGAPTTARSATATSARDLISLASMLRIPVYMHNVPEERVFRPSAWSPSATADLEGADFRACANFGPLYGRR